MNYKDQIIEITSDFRKMLDEVPDEILQVRPNKDSWSVAQILDHLIVINGTYFPVFEDLKNGVHKRPLMGNIGFLVNFFGKEVLKSVQPDATKKIKTFPIWEPSDAPVIENVVTQFFEHQTRLANEFESLQDPSILNQVISSPANRMIVYRLNTALEIIIAHEKRHLDQVRSIRHSKIFS